MGGQIAIIGMAGRFPGAASVDALWRVLDEGRDVVVDYADAELLAVGVEPVELSHHDYVKSGAYLPDISLFDAAFFGCTGREAEMMDPQQRIFLEVCQTALEESGHAPTTVTGPIGVYAGVRRSEYNDLLSGPGYDDVTTEFAKLGNAPDGLATKVAYKLDCTGPALTVQTACSSSLVAVHLAGQQLLAGECDLALAGGVSLRPRQHVGHRYREGGTLSRTGRCRPFDRDADGIIFGDGAGVVVLRRLADAIADGDDVLAVILGSATGNDGAGRKGYTAPGVDGQARAVRGALHSAGIKPTELSYVEVHGAGTPLGDVVEVRGLTKAFDTEQQGFCGVGSVKSNIGHLDCAAGVTGLIKTVLALRHGRIPATLHFNSPNPELNLMGSPFYVTAESGEWRTPAGQRIAGVTSLGIGGTNAHVIVGEAPARPRRDEPRSAGGRQLFAISARSPEALELLTTRLRHFLEEHPDVDPADVAFTLRRGRQAFRHRRAVVAETCAEAARALRNGAEIDAAAHTGSDRLLAAAVAWLRGDSVDWTALVPDERRRRVRLPAHPMLPKRYWPAAEPWEADRPPVAVRPRPAPADGALRVELTAIIAARLRVDPATLDPDVPFLEQGVDSLHLLGILQPIEDRYGAKLPVRQLRDELTTISGVAAYLERHAVAPVVTATIREAAQQHPVGPSPTGAVVERVIGEQVSLMRHQLKLLSELADRER